VKSCDRGAAPTVAPSTLIDVYPPGMTFMSLLGRTLPEWHCLRKGFW
jgi:hypothetical protein